MKFKQHNSQNGIGTLQITSTAAPVTNDAR